MKKKIVAIMFTVAALSLVGCSINDDSASNSSYDNSYTTNDDSDNDSSYSSSSSSSSSSYDDSDSDYSSSYSSGSSSSMQAVSTEYNGLRIVDNGWMAAPSLPPE